MKILELKLDKTIMGKDQFVDIEIDNQEITSVPVSRTSDSINIDITGDHELMEFKVCVGTASKRKHIGKVL